jgi:putative DNA primase/helicase
MVGRYPFNTALLGVLHACDKKGDCYVVTNPTKLPTMSLVNGGGGTKKEDVVYRRWFLLDCDAVRDYIRDDAGEPVVFPVLDKAGAPKLDGDGKPRTELKRHKIASDAECNPTLAVAKEVKTWLEGYGWSGIVLACSGNGGHLMVPCELPVDLDEEMERLVRRVQLACSLKFSTPQVKIECFNDVDRLTRAYGTVNLKGKETADRKYRQSYILEADPWPSPTPDFKSIMLRLAAENPVFEPERRVEESDDGEAGTCTREALQNLLDDWQETITGFEYQETGREDGFQVFCPGNDEDGWPDGEAHDDIAGSLNDSTIVFVKDGKFCFSCRHNHCGEGAEHGKKTWHDYREFYDPEFYEPEDTSWTQEMTPVAQKEKCPAVAYSGCMCGGGHYYPQSYISAEARATIDAPPDVEFVLTSGTAKGGGDRQMIGRKLSDITIRPVDWLWLHRVPRHKISLFSGKPGCGKSLAALCIAACVSGGAPWPDGAENTVGPRSVLIAVSEDDYEDTVVPRLMALGADLSRIISLELIRIKETGKKEVSRLFQLKEDMSALRKALREHPEIDLIILDPISGFYGTTDGNSNKDVRAILQELKLVCQETKVSVIAIIHENKRSDASATDKILGAGALSQVVRAGLRFSTDPENKGDFIMANIKNNLSRAGGGLRYKIEGAEVELPDGTPMETTLIDWGEQHTMTADDVLNAAIDLGVEKKKAGRPDVKTSTALLFLAKELDAGPKLSSEIYELAKTAGIGEEILKRAKYQLGLEYKRDNGGKHGGRTWCRLPGHEGTESQKKWWDSKDVEPEAKIPDDDVM